MPYPYGTQNAPAVGNGLGGLPRRATTGKSPFVIEVVSSGTITLPGGYSFFRVSCMGAGGSGSGYANNVTGTGGGGGGCAVSSAKPFKNGASVNFTFNSGVATATFGDTTLIANPGANGTVYGGAASPGVPGVGGTASGGEFNFQGGSGFIPQSGFQGSGGGAATSNGPGNPGSYQLGGTSGSGSLTRGAGGFPGAAPDNGGGGAGGTSAQQAGFAGGPAYARIELW